MKNISFILLVFFILSACNQNNINRTEFDEKASDNILIGYVNREGLKMEPFHEWFTPGYRNYQVKDSILQQLDKSDFKKNIDIIIVLGTWCSDSRREVPRFYKILDHLEYDTHKMKVICVNTNKQAPDTNVNKLGIKYIPVFIFYRNGKELGRIVESPQKSLEEDMLKILKK